MHTDDSYLVYQHKDINEIEKNLNVHFSNISDWFGDNKLCIFFGDDKTKSILFASKFKKKNIKELNIKYGDVQIKHNSVGNRSTTQIQLCLKCNIFHKCHKISISNLEMFNIS